MSQDGNNAATVLVSFTLGAIAGAAIALLYAPATGEETRRRLADKARESRDKAGKIAKDGKEFLNRQRETVSTAVEKGRATLEQVRKETL